LFYKRNSNLMPNYNSNSNNNNKISSENNNSGSSNEIKLYYFLNPECQNVVAYFGGKDRRLFLLLCSLLTLVERCWCRCRCRWCCCCCWYVDRKKKKVLELFIVAKFLLLSTQHLSLSFSLSHSLFQL